MKTIEYLMTGEGVTDFGQRVYGSTAWEEGPAAVLVRKCAEEVGAEIVLDFVERKKVENLKLGRQLKGLSGKAVPARRFYMLMRNTGYEHGIYYCDADRDAGARNTKHQAEERFHKVYDEVDVGANPDPEDKRVVPMVALRMIESWLLSDENAFQSGKKTGKGKKSVSVPSEPEMLWGDKRDPNSNYPKCYLDRLHQYYYQRDPGREDYVSIAEESSVEVIAQRCPISFGRFRLDLQESIKREQERMA